MIDRRRGSRGRGGFVSRGIIGMAYPALLPQGGMMWDGDQRSTMKSWRNGSLYKTNPASAAFQDFHVSSCVICIHIGIILKGVAKLIATGRHIIR